MDCGDLGESQAAPATATEIAGNATTGRPAERGGQRLRFAPSANGSGR